MTANRIVPIVMGSEKDYDFAKGVAPTLDRFGILHEYRVASGHKHPEYVLSILREYDSRFDQVVYIAVAGRSDALSGMMAANTLSPVIAYPPYGEKFSGLDVFSSLRTPSDTPSMVVLEPVNAALAAVKIFALSDADLKRQLSDYMVSVKTKIEEADSRLRNE